MLAAFRKLTARRKSRRYESQKSALESADVAERLTLASSSRTHREMLYYLAEHDPDPAVRRAVAENEALPVQASGMLAMDSHEDVRIALAGRLVALLPELSQDRHSRLYAYAVQALGTLALDEVLKIRLALSSALKDHACTPPKIAAQLARDIERAVAEPVLRHCAALADEDLLDILRSHPESWAVEAIAGRARVSAPVSEAVIETGDSPAGRVLIENEGAEIGEDLLRRIVEQARTTEEWQKPAAARKNLPPALALELAGFAGAAARDILLARDDFDPETVEEIAVIFRRRLAFAEESERTDETPEARLDRLYAAGGLNDSSVSDALAMRDYDFVYGALSRLASVPPALVQKIFSLQSPKPITALSWKAGLSMRLALQMQKEPGRVPPRGLLYPKGGTDYPLSEDEMRWQLEFLAGEER